MPTTRGYHHQVCFFKKFWSLDSNRKAQLFPLRPQIMEMWQFWGYIIQVGRMTKDTVRQEWTEECFGTGRLWVKRPNKHVPAGLLVGIVFFLCSVWILITTQPWILNWHVFLGGQDWLGGSVLKIIETIISPRGSLSRLISLIVNLHGFSVCRYGYFYHLLFSLSTTLL